MLQILCWCEMNENQEITIIDGEHINLESSHNTNQPGKAKVRKGQSQEEFEIQKQIYHANGPLINTQDWLIDPQLLSRLNNNNKYDRTRVIFACEKLYFERKYEECFRMIEFGEKFYDVKLDEVESTNSVNGKKQKSSKIDRQIIELMHIKQKCIAKATRS